MKRRSAQPLGMRTEKLREALAGKIAIAGSSGNEFVPIADIIRIQADGSYCTVHFSNRKPQVVSKNLKEFQQMLEGEAFFRTHKSHLVNLKHVKRYSPVKDGGTLEMSDASTVEIARTHKAGLAEVFNDLIR
jgi:two-component system LytT family response regulator